MLQRRNSMPMGALFAAVFFVLLGIAALTSTISLQEIIVAFTVEELHWSRRKSSIISMLVIFIIGVFCTLSFGPLKDATLFGRTIFDLFDLITALPRDPRREEPFRRDQRGRRL